MNTMPTTIPPTRPAESNAARTPEADVSDTPFSQVLSSEMANQRNAQAARPDADKTRPQETDARAGATRASDGGEAMPLAAVPTDAVPLETASSAPTAAVETAVPDAAALLGLAAAPAATPAAPVHAEAAEGEADAPETRAQSFDTGARRNRPDTPRTAPESSVPGAAAPKGELAVPGKAASPVAAAALQASQAPVAAAAQDAAKPADSSFDAILHPALRAAAQAQHNAAPPRLDVEAAQPRLAPAVGSAAWGQALGDRIVWMASAAQQTATLTLNPPNLGPLQVVLNISNDQAAAHFFAAQPEVRQALESALPRLKDTLNEAGIHLERATVSADASPQRQDTSSGRTGQPVPDVRVGAPARAVESPAPVPAPRAGRGLIDTFA